MVYLSFFFGDFCLIKRKWRHIVTFYPTFNGLEDRVEDQDRVLDHGDESVRRIQIHVQRIDPQLADLKINSILSWWKNWKISENQFNSFFIKQFFRRIESTFKVQTLISVLDIAFSLTLINRYCADLNCK